MSPRRVIVLCADWSPGAWSGLGVAVAHQARALAALGLQVEVLVARDDLPDEDAPGLRVRALPRGRWPLEPRAGDLVHVHGLRLAELALELRRRHGVPLVATVHGWPHLENPRSTVARAWSALQLRLLRACDRVVFLSLDEFALGLRLAPELHARATLVPHGLPAPTTTTTTTRAAAPLVLFSGRFAASKGLDVLGASVPHVLARREAVFVFAGGHGDAGGHAIVDALRTRFPDACREAGWLTPAQLDDLRARAALVVVPSAYEPFGLAALEAQRHGTPVLAADVGGLRDVVGAGSGGVRLASRDPRAWSEAIVALLDDAPRARALARRGPTWVTERYSDTACARRLLASAYAQAARAA